MPGGDLAGPRCRRGHRRTGVAGRAPGRSRPCLPCLPPEPWDAGGGPLPSCPSSGPRATGRHTRSCLPLRRARASRRRQPLWLSCWRSTREQAGTLRSPVGERQALGTDDHGDQAAARAGETSVPHLSCLSPSKYSPLPPRPHTSQAPAAAPLGRAGSPCPVPGSRPGHTVPPQAHGACRCWGALVGVLPGLRVLPADTEVEGPEDRAAGAESRAVGPQGRSPTEGGPCSEVGRRGSGMGTQTQ